MLQINLGKPVLHPTLLFEVIQTFCLYNSTKTDYISWAWPLSPQNLLLVFLYKGVSLSTQPVKLHNITKTKTITNKGNLTWMIDRVQTRVVRKHAKAVNPNLSHRQKINSNSRSCKMRLNQSIPKGSVEHFVISSWMPTITGHETKEHMHARYNNIPDPRNGAIGSVIKSYSTPSTRNNITTFILLGFQESLPNSFDEKWKWILEIVEWAKMRHQPFQSNRKKSNKSNKISPFNFFLPMFDTKQIIWHIFQQCEQAVNSSIDHVFHTTLIPKLWLIP